MRTRSGIATLLLTLTILSVATSCALKRNARRQALPGSSIVVKKGETLWDISRRYHVSIDDLMEINGIRDHSSLRVGQYLFVPDPELNWSATEAKKVPSKPQYEEDNGATISLDWPVKSGVMFRAFDKNPSRLFEGIALGAPPGTQVHAAAEGEVIYVGDDGTHFGRVVIIRHEDPFTTIYGHLDRIDVNRGTRVKKNDVIGTVGTSGGTESPRVYFQVRKNRTPVDPERYMSKPG